MRARGVVWGAAALAALLRFPGALWPIRPDEAGFTLVARHWDPQPDSLYGTYWVDRPPSLIAFVRLSDWVGGPLFLRVVAAVGCALLVLAAAATARTVLRQGGAGPAVADRMAAWTAVAAALFVGNLLIDPAAAKGEILGTPVVMASYLCALKALETRAGARATALAFAAGLTGMCAVGLKQSTVSGLVFGGVLLLGSWLARQLAGRDAVRLGAAALAGAAVPVVVTLAWAWAAGVRLGTLWYAVYGFRSDAGRVIAAVPSSNNTTRFWQLMLILAVTGMAPAVVWFLARVGALWARRSPLTAAVLVTVSVDFVALLLGGSYWRAYAFGMVPSAMLCLVLALDQRAARLRGRPPRARAGRASPRVVWGSVSGVSVVAALLLFVAQASWTTIPPKEYWTGEAIAAASRPGDTLVVYGGRADLQWASGLPSPYQHLWSLPMRTLDPELAELRRLLAGPDRPTWLVAWAPLDSWDGLADRTIGATLRARYRLHDEVCDREVWLRADVTRPHLSVDCDKMPY